MTSSSGDQIRCNAAGRPGAKKETPEISESPFPGSWVGWYSEGSHLYGYHPDECAVGQRLDNQQVTVVRRVVSILKAAHVVGLQWLAAQQRLGPPRTASRRVKGWRRRIWSRYPNLVDGESVEGKVAFFIAKVAR